MSPTRLAAGALALALALPLPLAAQHGHGGSGHGAAGGGLRSQVADLFRFRECDEPLCLPLAAGEHGNHYVPAVVQGQNNLIGFLTGSIASSVATLPISATSGGTLITFVDGRPVRQQVSGGPIFAERARTLGRGRLFLGANLSGFSYRTLAGVPLDALEFNFTHQDVGAPGLGDPAFENDVISVRADLSIGLLATTLSATYGLLDRLDVGVSVPLVRTSFSGRSVAQVFPFGEGSPHVFGTPDDPRRTAHASTFGDAFGIGDVAARAKAQLVQSARADVAAVAEVRFPTGDEENLLGSGSRTLRALGIVSARYGDFSPHANLGVMLQSHDALRDYALATVGFDHLLKPWATLAFDVLSRWQLDESAVRLPDPVQITMPYPRTVYPTNLSNSRDHAIDGSIGVRLTTSEGLTFVTNALVPVRRTGGLQPTVAWTLGAEYAF